MIFIRLVPVGDFGILNLVAGALRVPRLSFVLGNTVGLLPGLLGLGVIVDSMRALLRHPSPVNITVALLVLTAVLGLSILAKRHFRPGRQLSR